MPDTPARSPWDCAAAVRAIGWADRSGRAVDAAVALLRNLPGVLDAGVGEPLPGATAAVSLTAGGAVSVRCDGTPDPRLAPLLDTVAATLDAAGCDGGVVDFRDAVIAQMPSFIALFSPSGRLRWSNMVRWPDGTPVHYDETSTWAVAAMVHPADQDPLTELMSTLHARDPGGCARYTARVRRPDGGWMVMDIDLFDRVADPVIGGLITYGRDVTELHDTETSLRVTTTQLKFLVDSLEVGVLLQDADRVMLISNMTAVTLLELRKPPAELTGMAWEELRTLRGMPESHYAEIDAFGARCMIEGTPVRGAEIALGPDRVVEVDFVPVRVGEVRLGQLWVLRDVTAQVELKRALVRRNEELSRLANLKTEFIATVSHELRTPLTTLTSLTPMLADGAGDRVLGQAVQRNVNRLATLVETLLFLAGLESHSLGLSRIQTKMEPLVVEQIASLASHAATRSVVVLHRPAPRGTVLTGDRDLLARMVHHVIASAIGSSPPSGSVRVRSRTDDTRWTLEVTDESPLTVEAGRLFTTMPRGESATTDGDPLIGSGLGLTLARAIAERHGGGILLIPASDGGTTFRVELPLSGAPV
ncbi:sensor histidine kinase [Actinokineospora enzanensis]|uniref:sensor histidine kinase n=1 Tax=Actinokineospora enzanensis TaxID=155975 RepID=UPI000363D5BF|nr:ATP-binding protein [Actinokineospora enzanensis]